MSDTADRPSLPRPQARPHDETRAADAGPLRPRARPAALGETPAAVADAATVPAALDTSRAALLGVMQGPDGPAALIRLPDGTVRRVVPGDAVGSLRVAAIRGRALDLAGDATAATLRLPA